MGAWHQYNQLFRAAHALRTGNLEAASRYLTSYKEAA